MKPVLRKPSQFVRGYLAQLLLALRPSLTRSAPLSFDFKEEADLPGAFSAIRQITGEHP